MKLEAADLSLAWQVLLDVLVHCDLACYARPPHDYRLVDSKVRARAALLLKEDTRWGQKKRERLIDLVAATAERQGFIARTPLEGGPECVIDTTQDGEDRLFDGEGPVFEDAAVAGVRRERAGGNSPPCP